MHRLGVRIEQQLVRVKRVQFEGPVGAGPVDLVGVVPGAVHLLLGDPAVPDAARLVDQMVQPLLHDRLRHVPRVEQQQRDRRGMLGVQRKIEGVLVGNPRGAERKGRAFRGEPVVGLTNAHGRSLRSDRSELRRRSRLHESCRPGCQPHGPLAGNARGNSARGVIYCTPQLSGVAGLVKRPDSAAGLARTGIPQTMGRGPAAGPGNGPHGARRQGIPQHDGGIAQSHGSSRDPRSHRASRGLDGRRTR